MDALQEGKRAQLENMDLLHTNMESLQTNIENLQTNMEDLQTNMENLLKNLKAAKTLDKEMPWLGALGEAYLARAVQNGQCEDNWIHLTKAHALFNACLSRCSDPADQHHWSVWAQTTEALYLGFDIDVERRKTLVSQLKDQLQSIRNTSREQLIPASDLLESINDNNLNFSEIMRQAALSCNDAMKAFAKKVMDKCVDLLPLPCGLAVVGMGSLARGEATPYSDLEYMFLIQDGQHKQFFKKLAVLTYFIINNIGETPLKTMNIVELDDWEDRAMNGYKIDGLRPKAGNIPTGNGLGSFVFINTPQSLLNEIKLVLEPPECQNDQKSSGKSCDESDMLHSLTLIASYSDGEELFDQFNDAFWGLQRSQRRVDAAMRMLSKDVVDYSFLPVDDFLGAKEMFVKDDIYRFITIILCDLKILLQIRAEHVWKTVEILVDKYGWTSRMRDSVNIVLACAMYLRLSVYLHHDSQNDCATVLCYSDGAAQNRYRIPRNLFHEINTHLFPLQQLLSERCKALPRDSRDLFSRLDLKRDFDRARALSHAYCLEYKECLNVMRSMGDKTVSDILLCGSSYLRCGEFQPAEKLYEDALVKQLANTASSPATLAALWHQLGYVYHKRGCQLQALHCFDWSLENNRAVGDSHAAVAATHLNIGNAHLKLGKYDDAASSLKTARKMYRLPSESEPVHKGRRTSKAELASTYHALGNVMYATKRNDKSRKYYESALVLKRDAFGKDVVHPALVSTYIQLGQISCELQEYSAAQSHYENALCILDKVNGKESAKNEYRMVCERLGDICYKLHDLRQAVTHYERALGLMPSPNVPNSCAIHRNLGTIACAFLEYDKSLGHFDTVLQLLQDQCGPNPNTALADAYHDLGLAYYRLGHHKLAMENYTTAIEMRERC